MIIRSCSDHAGLVTYRFSLLEGHGSHLGIRSSSSSSLFCLAFVVRITASSVLPTIEIGALDGIMFSNSFCFDLGWKGVLIAGETKKIASLKKNEKGGM